MLKLFNKLKLSLKVYGDSLKKVKGVRPGEEISRVTSAAVLSEVREGNSFFLTILLVDPLQQKKRVQSGRQRVSL
jgi:hypothetical protein